MQDLVLEKIEGYPLLRSDIPTRNGRLYTDECLQTIADALKEYIEYHIPIITTQKDNNPCLDPFQACGAVTKAEIKDHVLYIDIDILDTPSGRLLFNMPAEMRMYFGPFTHVDYDKDLIKLPGTSYTTVKNLQFNYIQFLQLDPYFK